MERIGGKLVIDSPDGVGIPWTGPAVVDGKPWPAYGEKVLWLPAGAHAVEAGRAASGPRIVHFNGDLQSAGYNADAIDIAYRSQARAYAVLDSAPVRVEVDGEPAQLNSCGPVTLVLPRGQHLVTIWTR